LHKIGGEAPEKAARAAGPELLARPVQRRTIHTESLKFRGRQVATKFSAVMAWLAGALAFIQSTAAAAQDSLSNANPEGSGVIVRAVQWLQGTLLGTIATVVAVIAVASVGFLMLTGRINWRYGATVILGCFILFGAASIVAGIQSTASYGN
jgi:type IV secretion system protein VirB2